MKIFAFLVCLGLFVGSFLLFGYAFAVEGEFLFIQNSMWVFLAGIAAAAVSLMIPFHLLEKFD
ncbi:MAG TPA: hypothetical protein VF479_00120 [Pseudolysinimonas sp.]